MVLESTDLIVGGWDRSVIRFCEFVRVCRMHTGGRDRRERRVGNSGGRSSTKTTVL